MRKNNKYFSSHPSVINPDGLPSRPKGNKRKSMKKRRDWEEYIYVK